MKVYGAAINLVRAALDRWNRFNQYAARIGMQDSDIGRAATLSAIFEFNESFLIFYRALDFFLVELTAVVVECRPISFVIILNESFP